MIDERAREAVRLRGEGLSLRQIARQLGVGKSTAARWLAAAPASEAPAPPPPAPAPAGTQAMLEAVVSTAETLHEQALAASEPAVAGRALVDLSSAVAIGVRAEQPRVEGVEMTMAEIRARMAGIYQRARDLAAEHDAQHGATLCPGCGAQLAMAAMGEGLPALEQARPAAPRPPNPALARAAEVFQRATATIDSALEDGNIRAAQRANRHRTDTVRVVAREERRERERSDEQIVRFESAEVDERLERLRGESEVLAGTPLMCAPCLRRDRMAAIGASVAD